MFFSFEGIDGSGKSTQAQRLAKAMREMGKDVVEVREPGGTALGERVRQLLLDPQATVDPRAELLLFSAARAQLVAEVIKPALQRGAVVIADRFYDSSTAYQGGGRGVADRQWMDKLHLFATAGHSPDRTYLLDIPPVVAASRRSDRVADRMEQSDGSFYSRVRETYLELAMDPRVMLLDGTQPADAVYRTILSDARALVLT